MTSPNRHRRTKILVTIGPASADKSTLKKLIELGVDGFRFNFSHGTIDDFLPQLKAIRSITDDRNTHVTCLADLQGPKIRVGKLHKEPIDLKENSKAAIYPADRELENPPDNHTPLPINHSNLLTDFSTGTTIYVNEGKLTLKVENQCDNYVQASVLEGGKVWSDKGVNIPNTEFSVPAMTEKDIQDLEAIVKEDFDMVALSFVRKAEDLDKAREIFNETDRHVDLLAKIESSKALKNLDSILDAVEGIIVARGDLGVEIGPEKVPYHQKRMIKEANRRGRIVITATQMLETMIENPVPTRAEVSDVANAVLDVSDVVMLSGETAVGDYPVKTTETMIDIIKTTEEDFRDELVELSPKPDNLDVRVGASMSNAAAHVANEVEAKAIVAPTSSGFTSRMISKTYPVCPIIALSFKKTTRQKVSLYRNVKPYFLDKIEKTETLIEKSKEIVKEIGLVSKGESIVLLTGLPVDRGGVTNLLHVIEIENID